MSYTLLLNIIFQWHFWKLPGVFCSFVFSLQQHLYFKKKNIIYLNYYFFLVYIAHLRQIYLILTQIYLDTWTDIL